VSAVPATAEAAFVALLLSCCTHAHGRAGFWRGKDPGLCYAFVRNKTPYEILTLGSHTTALDQSQSCDLLQRLVIFHVTFCVTPLQRDLCELWLAYQRLMGRVVSERARIQQLIAERGESHEAVSGGHF
jgi:hypothetical protein